MLIRPLLTCVLYNAQSKECTRLVQSSLALCQSHHLLKLRGRLKSHLYLVVFLFHDLQIHHVPAVLPCSRLWRNLLVQRL